MARAVEEMLANNSNEKGGGARKMQHLPCTRMQEATMPLLVEEEREDRTNERDNTEKIDSFGSSKRVLSVQEGRKKSRCCAA